MTALLAPLTRPQLDCLLAEAEHAYVKANIVLVNAPLDQQLVYEAAGVAADCLSLWQCALNESNFRHITEASYG